MCVRHSRQRVTVCPPRVSACVQQCHQCVCDAREPVTVCPTLASACVRYTSIPRLRVIVCPALSSVCPTLESACGSMTVARVSVCATHVQHTMGVSSDSVRPPSHVTVCVGHGWWCAGYSRESVGHCHQCIQHARPRVTVRYARKRVQHHTHPGTSYFLLKICIKITTQMLRGM